MSLSLMSPVDFKKGSCRYVEFRGRGPFMCTISMGNFAYCIMRVNECWMFNAVSTARVIFTVKTSLEVFSLRQE